MAKNNITIILDDECKSYECDIEFNIDTGEFSKCLTIVTDKKDDYNERIHDRKSFEYACDTFQMEYTYDEFFKDDYTLQINGSIDDITYFIKHNKIENKEIIISNNNNSLSINDEEYIERLNKELKNKYRIYLKTNGNEELVKLEDYQYTIEYINNIAEKTREKNLSPFESLVYVYDIVRDRVYNSEGTNDPASTSRDLTSVIKGEKIVCLGFSEIFNAVVKKLGYDSKIQYLYVQDKKSGHARNEVYVKDEKYNIEGIYIFDPTAGSKDDDTNNHFDSYLFCGRTNKLFELMDEVSKRNYIDQDMVVLKEVYKKVKNNDFDIDYRTLILICEIYRSLFNRYIINPNYMFNMDEKIKEEFKTKIMEFYNLINSTIDDDTFMKILTNVRIKEYYEDSEKFPLSIEKRKEIFKKTISSKEENYIEDEEQEKNINRVVLTKTLQKVLQGKNK